MFLFDDFNQYTKFILNCKNIKLNNHHFIFIKFTRFRIFPYRKEFTILCTNEGPIILNSKLRVREVLHFFV